MEAGRRLPMSTVPAASAASAANANAGAGADVGATPSVVVTRPQPQADDWVAALHRLGVGAAALPLLGIAGPADEGAVHLAWQQLARQVLVMFVSPSAVERFFALRPTGLDWPAGVIAAGTGPGTRRALRQADVPEALLVSPPEAAGSFDSEALWAMLRARRDWRGCAALIVRGEGGRDWLADTLRQHGALPHFVEAYRRTVPVPDAAGQAVLQAALAGPASHVWLFSSSEAVGHLPALVPGGRWGDARALATHARIADAASGLGFGQVRQVLPDPDAVAALLRQGWPAG
jgi:uroporphyrinogen-III synthase